MYVLAAMLVVGFVCNMMIRPVAPRWWMKDEEVAALNAKFQEPTPIGSMGMGRRRIDATSILAWLMVGVPLAWGVWITLSNSLVLFR
jgi:hypothetical protein